MVLRALWSPLIDPHVTLTKEQRRMVMARAKQTFDDEYYIIAKFIFRGQFRKSSNDQQQKIKTGILLFITILTIALIISWLQARYQGSPVPMMAALKQIPAFMIPIGFMGVFWVIFFRLLPWITRPWMVKHVRRAICDLGYDEVCYRCGYRFTGLPWKRVQCPECGAVRARPRPIPKQEMITLQGLDDPVKP